MKSTLYNLACDKDVNEIERRVFAGDLDIHEVDDSGMNVLMKLVRSRKLNRSVLDALLRLGINVNAVDGVGRTALMYAAKGAGPSGPSIYKGSRTIALYLIDKGADLSLRDRRGLTALGHALRDNRDSGKETNAEMVKFLKHQMLLQAAMRYFGNRHSFSEEGVLTLELP